MGGWEERKTQGDVVLCICTNDYDPLCGVERNLSENTFMLFEVTNIYNYYILPPSLKVLLSILKLSEDSR